jgi:hypothetical protein
MSDLFFRAESILDVASVPGAGTTGTAIVLDRAGNMRIIDSEGWTLNGIIGEYGAAEVYMIGTSEAEVAVEGWSTTGRCTVTRKRIPVRGYAATSQVMPQPPDWAKERSPQVWNS